MQDALEVRIADPDLVHVVERVADVVDARTAHADALGHQARAALQVELAHVSRVRRVGDESERPHGFALYFYRDEARLVHAPGHLPVPEPRQRAPQARRVDAIRHAPARPAAAQPHHEAGLALGAAIARRENAERAVVTVGASERFLCVIEAGRPHERPVAEYPQVAFRQPRGEFAKGHCARTI